MTRTTMAVARSAPCTRDDDSVTEMVREVDRRRGSRQAVCEMDWEWASRPHPSTRTHSPLTGQTGRHIGVGRHPMSSDLPPTP